jgi:hypothetical protein
MHTEVQRKRSRTEHRCYCARFLLQAAIQLNTHIVHRADAAAVWGSRYIHICIHDTSNDGKYCSTVRHKTLSVSVSHRLAYLTCVTNRADSTSNASNLFSGANRFNVCPHRLSSGSVLSLCAHAETVPINYVSSLLDSLFHSTQKIFRDVPWYIMFSYYFYAKKCEIA